MRAFDPFPYGLLTMIVSLEAIFLSTFVLVSQNRMGEETERRAVLDLHIGLLTEHELTRVLQMLDAIQAKLHITDHELSDLADLEMETRPEDVLAEIDRLQRVEITKGQVYVCCVKDAALSELQAEDQPVLGRSSRPPATG